MAKDREEIVFDSLSGSKKHYCPDWDFMAIDETCPEFEACTCMFQGTEQGDVCNRDGCGGKIEIKPSENCSCHINPPCGQCTSAPMWCSQCLWEGESAE